MEQDLRRPDYVPRKHDRKASTLNCALASVGVTLMTLSLVGSAAVTTAWALGKLMGVSNAVLLGMAILFMVPVVAYSIWTAGRAWHVEKRMAAGLDVDMPVYSVLHYVRKRS